MSLEKLGVDYALIFNASSNAMAFTEWDSGKIVDVNAAWMEATGVAREDAIGHTAFELGIWAHAADREACLHSLREVRRVVDFEAELRLKSKRIPHLISARTVEMNGVRFALWEFRNVHPLKAAQQVARQNEERLVFAQEGAGVGIWEWDIVSGRIYWSPECERLYGFAPGTLQDNDQWRMHVDPEDLALIDAQWETRIARGQAFEVEFRFRRGSGDVRWLLTKGRAQYDADGRPVRLSGINMDITARKTAELELRKSADLLRDSQATAHIGSYINHLETGIYECTPVLDEIFGITADYPHTNAGWVNLMHPDFMQPMEEALTRCVQEQLPFNAEYKIIRQRDGAERWMHGLGRIICDGNGKALSLTGTVQDVTERKLAEEALTRAKNAAEAASRAKSEFLANMSHEIRTPLNGVIGNIQLLEMTKLDGEQKEYLSAMMVSANNLLLLIGDILDLSKIEAGRMDLEKTDFSLRGCVNGVILTQKSRIAGKRLSLSVNIADDVPDALIGDALRVKQILLNLLGNAIKFTAEGSISVCAAIREREADRVLIELEVADSGIGMKASVVEKIFHPFVQGESGLDRRHGGIGLGLAICRRLTKLMGGSITAESADGVGSRFRVLLPFALGAAARPDSAMPATPVLGHRDGAPLEILLAEDNEISQQFGAAVLRKMEHRVSVVENGQAALAAIASHSFDLVLMDIQMPVMNGNEALAVLRERERATHAHLPVIAVTAHALHGDEDKYLAEGFDGYVSKPLEVNKLAAKMKQVLERSAPAGTVGP